jgi:hypothetical protein
MAASLRERLFDIAEHAELKDHLTLIELLRIEVHHTITPVASEYPIERYTCAVHAFDLTGDTTYVEIASFGFGRTFAGADFIQFLLDSNRLVECDPQYVRDGDLVIYFSDGRFRHVGKLLSRGRLVSKWGTGHLYEHDLMEVPSSYGDHVRFFRAPTPPESLDLFLDYAETRGFQFRR